MITSPAHGSLIKGPDGVAISGMACGLREGDSGWLFDYDPHDGGYYSASGPIFRGNGSWSHRNQPIGDPGDNSKFYTLQIVLASQECGRHLENFPINSEGDKVLKRSDFTAGCEMIADIDIRVTWEQ